MGVFATTSKGRQRGVSIVGIMVRFVGSIGNPFLELHRVRGVVFDPQVCTKAAHFSDCSQRFETSFTRLFRPFGGIGGEIKAFTIERKLHRPSHVFRSTFRRNGHVERVEVG